MSENPNPTRCGNCGTDNPPGQDFCRNCGQPLTLEADAALLDEMPSILDLPPEEVADREVERPANIVIGGIGGAPLILNTDERDPH